MVVGQTGMVDVDKYGLETYDMNENTNLRNRLRALLDSMFGFTNRTRSTFKVVTQAFDNAKQEHVILLEYRVHVSPAGTIKSAQTRSKAVESAPMASIRELLAHDKRLS